MISYRVYLVDRTGRIPCAPRVIKCENDEAAIATAQQFVGDDSVEVWQGGRCVVRIAATSAETLVAKVPPRVSVI